MLNHRLMAQCLSAAFALTLAGTTFARRPPALVEQQERTDRVLSTCTDDRASSTAGYRDMYARSSEQPRTAPVAVAERMREHIVLVCRGVTVHGPGGYRDIDARFRVDEGLPVTASAPRASVRL